MAKRSFYVIIRYFIVCSIVVFTSLEGVYAASETITLKISNYLPPGIPQSELLKNFGEELMERTGGRIKVKYFAGGTLLKAPDTIKGVAAQVADIGLSHIGYTADLFPQMQICEMPVGYPSPWIANQVMNDYYFKFKPKEFDKYKLLWMHASGPAMIITKKPVRNLKDLKGMVLRAPGYTGEVAKALGARTSSIPIVETYDALATGKLDGVFIAFDALKSFKFAEVVKYATETWFVGTSFPFYVVMNKDSYDKMPPDLRNIFDHLTGLYRERFALMWNSIEFPAKLYAKRQGVNFIRLPYSEQKLWREAAAPVITAYINKMKAKGFEEDEINDWFSYLRQRIAFWFEMQEVYQIRMP